jgi:hypothetical protein
MAAKSKTPAHRYLRYELTNGAAGVETSHFIDLAKDLSDLNRRLYRQGRVYHVKRITVISSNTNQLAAGQDAGRISFSTAMDSWVARNAWKRGFEMFKMMNKKATMGISGDISAKFADFKVYLTDDHRTGTKLEPLDNGGNTGTGGEWTYSQMTSPDGTTSADEFALHLLGDHNGAAGAYVSVGLVTSYGQSRATVDVDQPNTPTGIEDDPLVNIFDDGTVTDEVIANLVAHGDNPPYDMDDYPGGVANYPKPMVVQDCTLGTDGRATVGGFTALCGLIEVESKSPNPSDVYSVLVELAPGSYRGVSADVI